jgi:hypothetical protein
MRCHLGRLGCGFYEIQNPSTQSLSPCWGSPQRQWQAKCSPGECLYMPTWGLYPLNPRRRYHVDRVDQRSRTPLIQSYRPVGVRRSGGGRAKRSPQERRRTYVDLGDCKSACDVIWAGLARDPEHSPGTVPIALLGFAAAAGASEAQPLGVSLYMLTGGLHPRGYPGSVFECKKTGGVAPPP